MVYRPTVRYADEFRAYVDDVFYATKLDRNQILRLALFIAAHSDEFYSILKDHQRKSDVPLPSPKWEPHSYGLWRSNTLKTVGERRDVTHAELRSGKETGSDSKSYSSSRGSSGSVERVQRSGEKREGSVHFKGSGGIRIQF